MSVRNVFILIGASLLLTLPTIIFSVEFSAQNTVTSLYTLIQPLVTTTFTVIIGMGIFTLTKPKIHFLPALCGALGSFVDYLIRYAMLPSLDWAILWPIAITTFFLYVGYVFAMGNNFLHKNPLHTQNNFTPESALTPSQRIKRLVDEKLW